MFSHENVSGMYGLSAAVIGGEDRHVQAALWSEGFLSQYWVYLGIRTSQFQIGFLVIIHSQDHNTLNSCSESTRKKITKIKYQGFKYSFLLLNMNL